MPKKKPLAQTKTVVPRLNKNAQAWVEALESGRYKQGAGWLCHTPAGKRTKLYCCLGVACELFAKDHKIALSTMHDGNINAFDGATELIPTRVQKWLGLRNNSGSSESYYTLAEMNDEGISFKKIAKFIRSKPKGLFGAPQ